MQTRLERMSTDLRPLFVTVTWGAGGSTASRSLELADLCQRQLGLTTCLHLTCTNMKKRLVDEALDEAKAMGIRNILALRGDPPRTDEYKLDDEPDDVGNGEVADPELVWAADLVRYIRKAHGDYFCIGVAGYPEGHADESHPTDQDPLHDLPYLVEKVQAGADFIMTQLFYNADAFVKYEKMLRQHESGAFATMPIIPGLMPIQSYEILKRTTKLAHVKLPSEVLRKIEEVRGDDDAVKRVGVDIISEIVQDVKAIPTRGPRPFHFFTLNLEKAVAEILERCELIPPDPSDHASNCAIEDLPHLSNGTNGTTNVHIRTFSSSSAAAAQLTMHSRRPSSLRQSNLPASHPQNLKPASREATWDDYPNGRYGDPRSPAFNPPLAYSYTSLTVTPAQALSLWGAPTSNGDITSLFLSHLAGRHPNQLPWSESITLNPETTLIQSELSALTTKKGYWTIASQPAVDGQASTHPVYGWGPPGGFVFQKSFVEFFLPSGPFLSTLSPRLQALHAEGEISYYAVNAAGEYRSSEAASAVHAVTWGSFKGKEIATATMVEEVSFRAWGDEAFGIWAEWARCVGEMAGRRRHHRSSTPTENEEAAAARGRQARDFLAEVRRDVWLVNVIGHAYMDKGRLWEVLLE